jgi:putative solute:sodium symporter small subunit
MPTAAQDLFWSRTLRVTGAFLVLWLLVSVGVPWFARDLGALGGSGGFAALYWLAAKGTLLMFLAIIVVHAWWMDKLEARCLADAAAAAAAAAVATPGADHNRNRNPDRSERD